MNETERKIRPRNRSMSVRADEYNTLRLSQILYSIRIKLGNRTQAECAKLLGCPTSTWSRHEKGNIKQISLDFVDKICETFGYTKEAILVKKERKIDKVMEWAVTEEARPYIEKAYKEYQIDTRNQE